MKLHSNLLIFLAICTALTSCVTTREQLNEERGVTENGNAESSAPSQTSKVQEEELPTRSSKTMKEPEVVTEKPALSKPTTVPDTSTHTSREDYVSMGVDELRVEVARLSGQAEELQHEKQGDQKSHEEALKKSEVRIAELEKQLKELQPDVVKAPEGKTPFDAGKDAFSNGKYDDAITFMSQSLEKQENGKEVEEATYIRAESFFKKQQFNKAIVDFSHFPEKFQKSSYHPKALLRIAECFEAMGRRDDAKVFYSDLLEKFPKTAEGKLAKKRLKSKK